MLLSLALLATLHAAPAADSLSGTWQIKGDVVGNPLDQACEIKQAGATLSGTCTGQAGEKLPLTGEVKDGKVVFKYASDYQGTALTIVFTSTASTAKQLKGSIEVQPMGVTGTFSATPAPAKP